MPESQAAAADFFPLTDTVLTGFSRSSRRLAVATASLTLLGSAFVLGAGYGAARVRARDAWADGRLLSTAIDSVRVNALDSLPNEELIRRAVAGMLRELHDPFRRTVLRRPSEAVQNW